MNSPRYLIVGASGFVGRHLYARLGAIRAIATYHQNPIAGGIHFDAHSMRLADTLLRGSHGLTHAFLMHGITKIDACAQDPQGAAEVNVESLTRMIDDLLKAGITPIFTSSDAVFDGTRGLWTEEDPTNPILTYGRHKDAVEKYLTSKRPSWVIARLSKVVGMGVDTHSLLGEWIRSIEAGETIRCARDQIFSPAYVDDVVGALIRLAERRYTGIFNVGGPRPMSRLELLNILIAEIRRYRTIEPKIIPCSIRDFSFLEARPLDTSLSSEKLYGALDTAFENMEAVCQRVAPLGYSKMEERIANPC